MTVVWVLLGSLAIFMAYHFVIGFRDALRSNNRPRLKVVRMEDDR